MLFCAAFSTSHRCCSGPVAALIMIYLVIFLHEHCTIKIRFDLAGATLPCGASKENHIYIQCKYQRNALFLVCETLTGGSNVYICLPLVFEAHFFSSLNSD